MTEAAGARILKFPDRVQLQKRLRQEAFETALVVMQLAQRLTHSENAWVQALGQGLEREATKTVSLLAQEEKDEG